MPLRCRVVSKPVRKQQGQPMWEALIREHLGSYSEQLCYSMFGVDLLVIDHIYTFLPNNCLPIYLLWTLYFMKNYPVAEVAAAMWKISERTFRDQVWKIIFILDKKLSVINFGNRLHDPVFGPAYLAVDSKLCPVQVHRQSWEEQKLWYDGYHRKHGIKYEIGVHIRTGMIHWISGGVFGSVADLTLLRSGSLVQCLHPGECIYCDKGYVTLHTGEHLQILCPFKGRSANLTLHQVIWNTHINHYRVIVENAIGRIWKFHCLQLPWRHKLGLHPIVFNVCAQVAALDIQSRPLRLDAVEYPELHALDDDDVFDV